MDIGWTDLQHRITALPNPQDFASQHGLAGVDCFEINQLLPPSSGQTPMRNALAALGYVFGRQETVRIRQGD